MNKEEYAKMMVRKMIVKSFISKMDPVSVKDVSLIPAFEDYVETGNKGMFSEYLDFHFIKDKEQRIRELNELEAQIEDETDSANAQIERGKKVRAVYEEAIQNYNNWRRQVLSQVEIDTKCDNANAIKEFLSVLDGIQHPERRKVYVIVDDKMLAITSARLTENNRIVFGTKYAFEVPYLDSLPGSDQGYLSSLCNLKL